MIDVATTVWSLLATVTVAENLSANVTHFAAARACRPRRLIT